MTTNKSRDEVQIPRLLPGGELTSFPPPDRWDDWEEYDAKAWPNKVKHQVRYVPTTCFNCESACGLLAVIDKESRRGSSVSRATRLIPDREDETAPRARPPSTRCTTPSESSTR